MKKFSKIIAILMAGALTLPLLASCTDDTSEDPAGTEGQTTATSEASTAATSEKAPDPTEPAASDQKYVDLLNNYMKKMNKDYYNIRTHVLSGDPRSGNMPAVWGFGAYLEALADWYHVCPDNEDAKTYYVDALDNCLPKYRVKAGSLVTPAGKFQNIVYYNAGAGGQGDYYYDDNAWICYQLLNAYVQLGEEKYLTEAENLLEFFKTGWDEELGGGIYWNAEFKGKNTCENGPIAICFLWAYQLTEKADYLEWGTKIYTWMYNTLRDGDLYNDSKNLENEINYWKSDYNQGTPIYAACLLYEITGEEDYLNHAKTTATAALGLAFKGSGKRVTMNGNPIYKCWCVGWLLRGFEKYIELSQKKGAFFTYMETVLDNTIAKPLATGYYDPYFLTGDWSDQSITDVLQPAGMASVIAICARYEMEILPNLK